MWEFIVMGQIPGTEFQISFTVWLLFTITLAGSWTTVKSAQPVGKTVRQLRRSQPVTAWRISYIMQTAAYAQLLATRRHIQA